MSRMVARRQIREGRSLGERLTELVVWIVIVGALIWGARWYFVVYRNSPKVALNAFLGHVKAGDAKAQYEMLSAQNKAFFGSVGRFETNWPASRDLAGRVASWQIKDAKEEGDKAIVDVIVHIRRPGQALYEAASDPYNDRWVLVREAEGWKIALDQSQLQSAGAAKSRR